MWVINFLLFAVVPSALVYLARDRINLSMMRFFRDLSRFKARKRLYGNRAALMPLLMGKEEPIDYASLQRSNDGDGFTMTLAELKEFDGRTESTPIYLAVQGYIFDVSSNREMYGPGGQYHVLAARDATWPLVTGCAEEHCINDVMQELTEEDVKEIDRWLEMYQTSDKYFTVGKLTADVVEELATAESEAAAGDQTTTAERTEVAVEVGSTSA